jgi:hypothetical protein
MEDIRAEASGMLCERGKEKVLGWLNAANQEPFLGIFSADPILA